MKNILQVIILFTLFLQISFAKTEEDREPITLDQATKDVTEGTESKVLSAETKTVKDKKIHVIKILTEKGRIQHIKIDAETGENIELLKENKSESKDK
jgi:uncharacterized membrane protein YkoI